MDDAIHAFDQGLVDLHASVWLRLPVGEKVKTNKPDEEVLETETLPDGRHLEILSGTQNRARRMVR
jgi:DNA-directed RNA polymerase subunit beta'